MAHEIHKSFYEKIVILVKEIFLDMYKTFDKVWHVCPHWKQRVVLNSQNFTRANIEDEVPKILSCKRSEWWSR